jgi:NitT/TauT family transport system substrate-binding protein
VAEAELRVQAARHSAFYTPLLVTLQGEFLAAEGLRGSYAVKPPGKDPFAMLLAGEVDVVQSAVSSSWARREKGARELPFHFAQINQRDGFFLSAREPSAPFDWSSLEGRVILADHGPQPLAMLRYAAHLQKVDWSRVVLVDAGSPESMDRTFRRGRGDFIHQQGPAPQQLEEEGVGRVVAAVGRVLPPVAFSTLMATGKFLRSERARGFMRAYRKALAWVSLTEPFEVAGRLASLFPRVGSGPLGAAIRAYQELGCWKVDPAIPVEQYERAAEVFLFSGGITRRHPFTEVVVPPPA